MCGLQHIALHPRLERCAQSGCIDLAAAPLVPPDLRRIDPGYPDNAKVQLPIYAEWYGDNQGRMLNQFIDLVSS